jgi:hypothetical protein
VSEKIKYKKENLNVFGEVCFRTLKAHNKEKRELKVYLISGVTCPNQGHFNTHPSISNLVRQSL